MKISNLTGFTGELLTYDPDHPTRCTETLSKAFYDTMSAAQAQGFHLCQEEEGDYSEVETLIESYAESFGQWMETAYAQSEQDVTIAELPAIPDLFNPGGLPVLKGSYALLIAKIAVKIVAYYLKRKIDNATTTDETAKVLKQALLIKDGESLDPVGGSYLLILVRWLVWIGGALGANTSNDKLIDYIRGAYDPDKGQFVFAVHDLSELGFRVELFLDEERQLQVSDYGYSQG